MKKFLPDLIAILAFAAISFVYFFPAVMEDRVLFLHDTVAGAGAGQETKAYYEETGERSRWTNSLFGGMPTYQISPTYDSARPLRFVEKVYHLFLPSPAWLVFVMMFGFYLLLRAFGVPPALSAVGGIAWGFSSYFFILISAGHIWKFITLAYIPPTIAGIVLAYRGRLLAGGVVTALFIALQVMSNHVQMTYYFLFVILFMVIAYFADAWRKKELPSFFKATAVLLAAGLTGVSINLSNLYHTYDYGKETMRGKSELVYEGAKAEQVSGGLNRDYITNWSYGIGETFTLLVPNTKGGASVPLAASERAMEKANPAYSGLYSQLGQYWGDQPGTSGPVYVGAFILTLFIFGLFVVKGPMKWALLAATLLSVLLAWGKNFMGLTDFFIDYIPMYDKFRAVSSILVIAEFTIPLLAILALKEIITKPETLRQQRKYLYVSLGLTGGLALLFALFPKMFFSAFIPPQEMYALQSAIPANQLAPIITNIEEMRVHLFTGDAWRSFFVVLIGAGMLFAYGMGKLKAMWTVAGIAALCLVDLWTVDKRYLNDSQFKPATVRTETFRKTQADAYILQDTDPNFRVLNFVSNTFNENNTSYHHKSVGGYHAAKLLRYQEMIDHHIGYEMQEVEKADSISPTLSPVLNMLNTKYFISLTEERTVQVVQNPFALGHAWFVNEVRYVNTANEEIEATGTVDPRETAIVDARFKDILKAEGRTGTDSTATISLLSYAPNRLVYESSSATDGVAVFSEVWYPRGWKVTIDGEPALPGRANYILRALHIPPGKHTIEMRFDPSSLRVTETAGYIGLAMLLAGGLALLFVYRKKFARAGRE